MATLTLRRRYTIRRLDPAAGIADFEIEIHDGRGPATRWAANAQLGEHLQAAAPGEHHVENDEIDVLAQSPLHPGIPVERRAHLEAVGRQPPLEEVDDPGLILDGKNQSRHQR